MELYKDRELFKQLITLTSKKLKISLSIVEKDYHIMNILKELMVIDNSIVFKGGTSLSKCFKVINRFSEDLDLSYYNGDNNPTESMRKRLNKSIVDISSKYGYTITNLEDIKSRRAYNKFELSYSANFGIIESVKSNLLVETAMMTKVFPTEFLSTNTYIYDYLITTPHLSIIQDYDLQPFQVNVQSLERTFIDKIFAICDYYLDNTIFQHSRHIYDIYKILPKITINDDFRHLVQDIRKARHEGKSNNHLNSANPKHDINAILQQIIDKQVYKSDYENITAKLLFELVPYEVAIKSIRNIIKLNLF